MRQPLRRILLRSGKDPFLALSAEETLTRNAFGSNTGNMIFAQSVHEIDVEPFRHLSLPCVLLNCFGAEPRFAEVQERELRLHLADIFSNQPVEVLRGNKVVELRQQGVHKGLVVSALRSSLRENALLVVGPEIGSTLGATLFAVKDPSNPVCVCTMLVSPIDFNAAAIASSGFAFGSGAAVTLFGQVLTSTDAGQHWQVCPREFGEIRGVAIPA